MGSPTVEKKHGLYRCLLALLGICILIGCFFAGRITGRKSLLEEKLFLQQMNRSSIENMILEDGPIYVIGHRSPDTDTVCSAIAYARLLTSLGYDAEAAITMPVNNETAFVLERAGEPVPPELTDASGKNIFLVDHSEYAQAAEGMNDAHIVGILDHHGDGSVTTGHQLVYEARPIGATATIVWLDYMNYGVEIDRQTAQILLGAILSDTSNLTGSTTTEADRQAVPILAEIAGETDVEGFYAKMHEAALSYEGMTDIEIMLSDYKEYEIAGLKIGIGQISAVNEEVAADLASRMKEVLPTAGAQNGVDLIYASVGMRENGEKIDRIVPGDERAAEVLEAAFPDYDEFDGTSYVFRTGLGRKTKLVPGLTEYLNAVPAE